MYGCESWTVKKAEHWRIDAFELWCWRRLLRVPWTARRSNQSFLKEISPGISLDGMMLKLKLQYFGHLMRRFDSLERLWRWEGLGAGGKGDDQEWDVWMASQTRCTWIWVNSGRWWWTGRPGVLRFMGSQRVGHDWATELNWTEWEWIGAAQIWSGRLNPVQNPKDNSWFCQFNLKEKTENGPWWSVRQNAFQTKASWTLDLNIWCMWPEGSGWDCFPRPNKVDSLIYSATIAHIYNKCFK